MILGDCPLGVIWQGMPLQCWHAERLKLIREPVLITDFDGTITAHDFYQVILDETDDHQARSAWDKLLDGTLTHVESLDTIFTFGAYGKKSLNDYLHKTELDPDFVDVVNILYERGWTIIIASAGACWYIRSLLQDLLWKTIIVANPASLDDSETSLRMFHPPTYLPWYSAHFGVDKCALINSLRQTHQGKIVFVGDGRPDLSAILQVRPERRFARGWLAETLTLHDETYHRFTRWRDILNKLRSLGLL